MKKHNTSSPPRLVALLFGAALLGLVSQSALALTASGISINNIAKLSYTVGATAQNEICSAPAGNSTGNGGTSGTTCTHGTNGAGNTTFVVDNKVNLVVTKDTDNATTVPGLSNQAVAFTLTNTGNTAQRYALSAVVGASTLTNPLTSVRIFLDVNNDNLYDGGDTLYVDASTFGDVAAGASLNLLIVANAPAVETNGQTEVYSLLATTVNAGTLVVTTQVGAGAPDTPGSVDVVFADPMSGIAGDSVAVRDGKHAASATYTIATAALTVSKTSSVYSDPITGVSANAKAIPGAVITYTITIANAAGGATATSGAIADSLATEIVAGRLAFATQFTDGTNACAAGQGVVVAGGGEIAGGVCKTNAVGGDAITSADFTANVVNVTGLSIAGGTTATIKFQVTIQ